jgi:uncharacterized membrane protein
MTFLRVLMLLALIVWVGGIIFFAFVLAPTVFAVLPTTLAGNVVSRSLTALHWMGMVSTMVFLICSMLYSRARFARLKPFAVVNLLVLLMLVLTLISQFAITPRMHALRAQMALADTFQDPARIEFNQLHAWSTRLEGGTLVLGLVVVVLTARRFS